MNDYELHLNQLREQQTQLTEQIQKLSLEASEKRDLLLKVQGAIEYIEQINVDNSQPLSAPVVKDIEQE
jgi:hypothetical protein